MASHVVVIAGDLRRTTVKVTPGIYLIDVLQEACRKLNLASDKYLIKHKQKQVDLSIPFRTSGLLPGAKLELVQKSNTPSAVQIALQLPQPEAKDVPGGRLIRKFPSDLTLWKVLRQFESGEASGGRNINITARGVAGGMSGSGSGSGSGQLYYETPVLNIMGRELSTFTDFQRTLSQLGHNSGNVLIRLSYRKTEQTLFDMMEQINQFFKETEEQDNKADGSTTDKELGDKAPEPPLDTAMTDAAPPQPPQPPQPPDDSPETQQTPAQQQPAPTTTDHPAQEAALDTESQDPYQPVNVFLAPTGTTPAAALEPTDDTDFTLTVAQAQLHQARLQQSSRNTRLLSDKELEEKAAAEEARIAAIKSVLVKVRFPDNTSSDWNVGPHETGAFLYEAVRRVMASSTHSFRLVLPGGKTVIQDDSGPRHGLVKDYRLSGRVLVNLVWDDSVPVEVRKQPFLRNNVAERGQAVKVPELPVVEDDKAMPPVRQPPQANKSDGQGAEGAKKVPKWFKFGKK